MPTSFRQYSPFRFAPISNCRPILIYFRSVRLHPSDNIYSYLLIWRNCLPEIYADLHPPSSYAHVQVFTHSSHNLLWLNFPCRSCHRRKQASGGIDVDENEDDDGRLSWMLQCCWILKHLTCYCFLCCMNRNMKML